jgi:hypothetical protein
MKEMSAKEEAPVITRRYAYIANERDVSKSRGPIITRRYPYIAT